MRTVVTAVVLVAFGAVAVMGGESVEARPDWWKAQCRADELLFEKQRDLVGLAKELSESKPKTAQNAMLKVCVLMRAGLEKEAVTALGELKERAPQLDNHAIESIYYEACDRLAAHEFARRLVEVFAGNIRQMPLGGRLFPYLMKNGWSVEKVDRWLAGMPAGRDGFWIKERLRFNVQHKRADRLVQRLADRVKKEPENVASAHAFLEALAYARRSDKDDWDLSWLPAKVKPERAVDARKMGDLLQRLHKWSLAVPYYKTAANIPVTDKEVRDLSMMYQAMVSPKMVRAGFAVHVREQMACCYLQVGEKDKAQALMVEAADLRKENGWGRNALLAGRVQGASGQRVIEGRIKKEEKESKDDPKYWRERARYYRGRKESDKEEHALKKALVLTEPKLPPGKLRKGFFDVRAWALSDYASFLKRQKRDKDAVALLRREMERGPADAVSVCRAANRLSFDFPKHLDAEDDLLWKWLQARAKWEHTEERFLWRMLENAGRKGPHLSRAEKLAEKGDPSRAYVLGWTLNRMELAKRSLAPLQRAVEQAEDDDLRERAAFALFESYLDIGDWRNAEGIFGQARKRLTSSELPSWYGKIAVMAAQAGAKKDAIRIWIGVVNTNPSYLGNLDEMVKAGLKKELIGLYHELQRELPSSTAPARALKALKGR